ncbi:hypothetical protein CSUI_002810 [Cystoisospora suis]|uniref:Transmembrane protein n=1 Tax=Cystoisospora suis TaxID=483139 RepID=A0A2C6L520_9APIC|nr:hypothetical protein CSUI_002810 [Cystoisospora suis]
MPFHIRVVWLLSFLLHTRDVYHDPVFCPCHLIAHGSEVKSLQPRSLSMKSIKSHTFSAPKDPPIRPPYLQPSSGLISHIERFQDTRIVRGGQEDTCDLKSLLSQGSSAGARLKIRNVRELNKVVSTVFEERKEAFRRCSAGEKDRCETPDRPIWETLGIPKPPALPRLEPFRLSPACNSANEDQPKQTRNDMSSSFPTGDTRKKRNSDLPHQSSSVADPARRIEKPIRSVVKMEHINLSKVSLNDLLPRVSRTNKSPSETNLRVKNRDREKDGKDVPILTPSAGSVEHIPEDREIISPSHKENQDDNFSQRNSPHVETRVVNEDSEHHQTAFVQVRAHGIFDMIGNLFGNGADISNPQNFEGGNQGSYFDFMYPQSTDYPWACVCDENKYKQWEAGEIDAVPCRNQVDMSAQGITAACNPKNHKMNGDSSLYKTSRVSTMFLTVVSFFFIHSVPW